jgi:hypothetical protein
MQLSILPQSNALAGLRRVSAALAASLLLTACSADHDTDCLKGNGEVVTERRAIDRHLRAVALYNNVDLTIVPDTATYAEVRAGEHVIRDIEFSTPVSSQQLVIKNTSRCNWVRGYDTPREVRLHVASRQGSFYIEQYGYGLTTNEGLWTPDTLRLRLRSTGDFNLNLRAAYVSVDSYDTGDVTLRGTVEDFHPNMGSNGFLFAKDLDVRYCYLYTYPTWQGDMHVRIRDLGNLAGTLNGKGRLFYTGKPGVIDLKGTNVSHAFKEE